MRRLHVPSATLPAERDLGSQHLQKVGGDNAAASEAGTGSSSSIAASAATTTTSASAQRPGASPTGGTAASVLQAAAQNVTGLLSILPWGRQLVTQSGLSKFVYPAESPSACSSGSGDPLSADHIDMRRHPHIMGVWEQAPLQHEAHAAAAAPSIAAAENISSSVNASDGASGVTAATTARTDSAALVPPASPPPPASVDPSRFAVFARPPPSTETASASAPASASSTAASASAAPSAAGTESAALPPEEAACIAGLRSMGGWINVDVRFDEPFLPGLPDSHKIINHMRIVDARPWATGVGSDVTAFIAEHCFIP